MAPMCVFGTSLNPLCHLCGQTFAENVNDARYKALCMATSALPELSMPLTIDALFQHCKRANYQAAIMRHSLKSKMCPSSPIGNEGHLISNELTMTWMTKSPAPERQAVHCSCKQSICEPGRCSCMSARLCCTDLCWCQNCGNVSKETEDRATWDDDSDDSDVEE